MSEVLSLEHFSVSPTGPTLTMSISSGQSVAIVGPGGSGKSFFLRAITGAERVPRGSVRLRGTIALSADDLPRRAKVQSVARPTEATSDGASQALMATHLWDVRQQLVSDLTRSQVAAAELLPVLSLGTDVAIIDGRLDLLDPWTLSSVLELMRSRHQTSWIVATNRPDLLHFFDLLVVLKDLQVRFAGSPADLLRHAARHEITVTTENQESVRSLASPFEVTVRSESDQIHLTAREGQELAAKLLMEGYGDVSLVVSRPPTLEEALLAL